MASPWFLQLTFKCLHHLAWPLVALVYPMCASVHAIETDSYAETKNLISYWILLSLIYLFEYAFINLLLRFHLWPYTKLMIIFWLIIPDFGRASYVYNKLISSMKPQIVTWGLNNYWRKWFFEKDNFLMHAERYMKDNGTEALEKLIASKNTMCRPDAEATNEIIATDNKEMLKTNGERLQIEHKDIKDLEAIEKKEIPATKQDIPVMPKIGPRQNASSVTVETKGTTESERAGGEVPWSSTQKEVQKEWMLQDIPVMPKIGSCQNASSATVETKVTAESDRAGGEVPQSSTQKEVQKEWTCALCLVTTSSEKTLNSHLSGRKHRASIEALISKKQPTMYKQKDAKVTNKIIATDNKEILKTNGERFQKESKDIKDLEAIEKKEIPATKQRTYPDIVVSQKASSAKVEAKGTAESDRAGGKVSRSSTSAQKEVEWTCALCSVTATSKKDLNSHLNGRNHRDASEAALKAKKQLALQKLKISQSKEEVKQINVSKKVQKLQKKLCEPVRMHNSKLICVVCNAVLHNEANVVSHMNGKMHLAKMQSKVDSLNNLRGIA